MRSRNNQTDSCCCLHPHVPLSVNSESLRHMGKNPKTCSSPRTSDQDTRILVQLILQISLLNI